MADEEQDLHLTFENLIQEQEAELNSPQYGSTESRRSTNEQPPSGSKKNSSTLEEIQLDVIRGTESSTLVRNRMRSVKESSAGIEDILGDMPSRTVGRKRGAKYAGGTVNRYGSTYRRQRLASSVEEVDADEIYREIVSQDGEVDNNELRELPVNMTLKRKVRSQVIENQEQIRAKSITSFSLLKYRISLAFRHKKDDFNKFFASLGLWNHHLKTIEGTFGTGVLSYFTFLRGIFLLSLPSFVLSFAFISIPQLIDPPPHVHCKFTGEEILTGGNCLTNTIMYQGYYTNHTIHKIGSTYYNMPLAYLLAMFGYFVLCLVWLSKSTAGLFRSNYITAKEDSTSFFNKVFCSWDFGTTSQSTAVLLHKTITTDLKEVLAEKKRGVDHRTGCEKFELFLLRLILWSVYLCLLGGSVALVYFTNKKFICDIRSNSKLHPIIQDLALPLIVSTINLLLPYVVTLLTHAEKYKYRRHELYISVLRNFLFKMSLLGVICAFWTSNELKHTCNSNSTSIEETCWETELGEEIYRLVIVDFIFSLIFSTFVAEFLRNVLSKVVGWKPPEFTISNNVLDLIYGQTLCWIGVYFSPLLALLNMMKYFILFYVKRISVMNNCRPSTKRWRANQSQTMFNFVQLVSFLLSCGFLTYVIFSEVPSETCGPFRGKSRAYDIILDKVIELASTRAGNWLAVILQIVTNVWMLYSVLIVLLIILFFVRMRSKGLSQLAETLKEQIALEGKDKGLLLKWLQGTASFQQRNQTYNRFIALGTENENEFMATASDDSNREMNYNENNDIPSTSNVSFAKLE